MGFSDCLEHGKYDFQHLQGNPQKRQNPIVHTGNSPLICHGDRETHAELTMILSLELI